MLTWLKDLLQGRLYCQLKALKYVKPLKRLSLLDDDGHSEWLMTKSPALFQFVAGAQLIRGWYMLDIELYHPDFACAEGVFWLVVIPRGKRGAFQRIALPYRSGLRVKRIFRLDVCSNSAFVFLRINREDCSLGSVVVKRFSITRLSRQFVYSRMTRKVVEFSKAQPESSAFPNIHSAYLQYHNIFQKQVLSQSSLYRYWINNIEEDVVESGSLSDWQQYSLHVCIIISPVSPVSVLIPTLKSLPEELLNNTPCRILFSGEITMDSVWCAIDEARLDRTCFSIESFFDGLREIGDLPQSEYIIFLNAGELLSQYAAVQFLGCLSRYRGAELIYVDSDEIDVNKQRYNPYFKPGWSPDLLSTWNYIGGMVLLKASAIQSLEIDVSDSPADCIHWLCLSLVKVLHERIVLHLPQVLTHRCYDACQFVHGWDKSSAMQGRSSGEGCLIGDAKKVSVIIPTRDNVKFLKDAVWSVLECNNYKAVEVLIVDNGSVEPETHEYLSAVEKMPDVHVVKFVGDFNFSAINNKAVSLCSGEFVLLLNNDVKAITPDWLYRMMEYAQQPGIGCVGAKLLYEDDTVQHAGIVLGFNGIAGHAGRLNCAHDTGHFGRLCGVHNVSAVTAACLLMRRSIYEAVLGMDEQLPIAYNDVDLCLRVAQLGYRNLWVGEVLLYHFESKSRGLDNTPGKRKRLKHDVAYMRNKWGDALCNDPFYSDNWVKSGIGFQLSLRKRDKSMSIWSVSK